MIEIDGSFGEGGGQILRTALSLSSIFMSPFRIFNIRKGRKKPGLMPQHIACVRAMQLLSGAEVTGDEKGSLELTFKPRKVKGGDFFFDIGTAGSVSLVFQTIIPSLVFTGNKGAITLNGGTHVPFSPPFDYLKGVFVPVLGRLGVKIDLSIESYGFYPKGGGKIRANIFPPEEIKPLRLTERGRIVKISGCSGVGNLPVSIAERQRNAFINRIKAGIKDIGGPVEISLADVPAAGQGSFIHVNLETENALSGFTALGERGKRAELVGEEAATELIDYYSTGAALDKHFSDQIVLYLSMSKGDAIFTTSCITQHLITNLQVIDLFCKIHYSLEGDIGKPGAVKIMRAG